MFSDIFLFISFIIKIIIIFPKSEIGSYYPHSQFLLIKFQDLLKILYIIYLI